MAEVKCIGVREFRNNASTYLSGSETIAVNRHGKVIGFYIPLERDEDEVRRAIAKLGAAVGQVLEETVARRSDDIEVMQRSVAVEVRG